MPARTSPPQRPLRLGAALILASLFGCAAALPLHLAFDRRLAPDHETPPSAALLEVDEPSPPLRPAAPHEAFLKPILERSFFDSSQVGNPSPEQAEDGAETELPYLLLGTIVAMEQGFSSALIREDRRSALAMRYGLGEALEPGVILVEVRRLQVVLQRADGTLETLTALPGDERRARQRGSSADGKVVIRRTGTNTWQVSDAALARVYEDPDKVMEEARAKARQGQGVRLSRVTGRSPLRKLGLRSGDVLSAVNGQQVRTVDDLAGAWRSVAREQAFTVELLRKRKETTLRYEVL